MQMNSIYPILHFVNGAQTNTWTKKTTRDGYICTEIVCFYETNYTWTQQHIHAYISNTIGHCLKQILIARGYQAGASELIHELWFSWNVCIHLGVILSTIDISSTKRLHIAILLMQIKHSGSRAFELLVHIRWCHNLVCIYNTCVYI